MAESSAAAVESYLHTRQPEGSGGTAGRGVRSPRRRRNPAQAQGWPVRGRTMGTGIEAIVLLIVLLIAGARAIRRAAASGEQRGFEVLPKRPDHG